MNKENEKALVAASPLAVKLAAALCCRCANGDERTRIRYIDGAHGFFWAHRYHKFANGNYMEKSCMASDALEVVIDHEASTAKEPR